MECINFESMCQFISYNNQGQDGNCDGIPDYDHVLGELEDADYSMLSGYVN